MWMSLHNRGFANKTRLLPWGHHLQTTNRILCEPHSPLSFKKVNIDVYCPSNPTTQDLSKKTIKCSLNFVPWEKLSDGKLSCYSELFTKSKCRRLTCSVRKLHTCPQFLCLTGLNKRKFDISSNIATFQKIIPVLSQTLPYPAPPWLRSFNCTHLSPTTTPLNSLPPTMMIQLYSCIVVQSCIPATTGLTGFTFVIKHPHYSHCFSMRFSLLAVGETIHCSHV